MRTNTEREWKWGFDVVEVIIQSSDDGKVVHKWLRLLLPGMPLSGVYKFIRTGRLKVNGKRAKQDHVLHTGDVVFLYMTDEDYEASTRIKRKKYGGVSQVIDVRYEDDELLIVNKPAGVLVHAADGNHASTLQARVEAYVYRTQQVPTGQAFHPAPVHRLDRNTSGLVLFAKTSRAARYWGEAFKTGDILKEYVALVHGRIVDSGVIRSALERRGARVTEVVEEGKESVTHYEPIGSASRTTLLRIRLETGRTHQIRAHLASKGHSLVGDRKYGGAASDGDTFYLHAFHLRLSPEIDVFSSMPDRFQEQLTKLGYRIPRLTELRG